MLIAAVSTTEARAAYFSYSLGATPVGTAQFTFFNDGFVGSGARSSYIVDSGAGNGTTTGADGYGQADLADGSLRINLAANLPTGATSPTPFAEARAAFGDHLTFLGDFSNTHVTITQSVDGSYQFSDAGIFNLLQKTLDIAILPGGTLDGYASHPLDAINDPSRLVHTSILLDPDQNGIVNTHGSRDVVLNGHDPSIDLVADFHMRLPADFGAGSELTADFFHSALFGFNPLPGVTVLSDSGAFPGTAAVAPVPEPGSLTLTGSALALALVRLVWRHRRSCPEVRRPCRV
jgi:hypothetical protein